ncbi:DUF342 domain-containing protein [Desulfolucanica intricata]|uniref:DUF342 domain-containing protein n=1 Tax=Desulfolucanica intricata TaxID=1285191 RepID=UPI000835BF49|nr:flagellar assembly protein A [Desulfolucanica intricata]
MIIDKKILELITELSDNKENNTPYNNQTENFRSQISLKEKNNFMSPCEQDTEILGDGYAYIKSGKIYVTNPKGNNSYAVIAPCEGISLWVNGELLTDSKPVKESDTILAVPDKKVIPPQYAVEVSADKLSAKLIIKLGETITYSLIDQEPQRYLRLKAAADKKLEPLIDKDQIWKLIMENNIIYGIKTDVLDDLITNPKNFEGIIAEGIPPGPGRDEYVNINFTLNSENKPICGPDGNVDYKNLSNTSYVEQGYIMATKTEGFIGTPGKSITGEIISPPIPKAVTLKAGKGVDITDNIVIAQKPGKPSVDQIGSTYIFYIQDKLIHQGNVDLSSGNLRFKGSIEITGSVQEGMSVFAADDIFIHGLVSEANITSIKSITVLKNVVRSNLLAGGISLNIKKFAKNLQKLKEILTEAILFTKKLLLNNEIKESGVKPGYVLLLIIEKKFNFIPRLINKILEYIEVNRLYSTYDFESLSFKLKKYLPAPDTSNKNVLNDIEGLIKDIDLAVDYINHLEQNDADIIIEGALNSSIEANRNVIISGNGCFNSHVKARGDVKISGVFRGGSIYSNGNIVLNEVGSQYGVKTSIIMGNKATLSIRKAYENIIIKTETKTHVITVPQKYFSAKVDTGGQLNIISGIPVEES